VNMIRSLIALCCIVVLAGCAVKSGRTTSIGAEKLKKASQLFSSKDEPVEAEEMIRDVIALYEQDKNQIGLAEAYRQYGLFYRSNAVNKFAKYYKEKGFLDKTVKFAGRYEKSVEYFKKSMEIYTDYGNIEIMSNLYVSLGKTYDLMDKKDKACEAFNKGLENFATFKKGNPEAKELRSEELANYESYIDVIKKQVGCVEGAAKAQ